MEFLQVLLDPILPVFAIMAFGFFMGRTGRSSVEDAKFLNRFAFAILLPIMVFGLIANAPIHTFSFVPLAVYAGAEALVFLLGFLLAFCLFERPAGEAFLLALCGIFANSGFYVLPISLLIYGQGQILPVTSVIFLDATVTFAGTMIAVQLISQGRVTIGRILVTVAKTPVLPAIALGVVFSLARIPIPAPVQTFIDFNGVAAAPVALYALGVAMSRTAFKPDWTVATFTGIKLLSFPGAVWLGLELFAADAPGRQLFLFTSAGPSAVTAFSLALLYNIRSDAIAQVTVYSGVLTLGTMAFLA